MPSIKCWFGKHQYKYYKRIVRRVLFADAPYKEYNQFRVCLRCGKREKIDG